MSDPIKAANAMDWQQVVLNGGPPCFHLEQGRFCGRAQRWEGHEPKHHDDGIGHKFVPLADLVADARRQGMLDAAEIVRSQKGPDGATVGDGDAGCHQDGWNQACEQLSERITQSADAIGREEWLHQDSSKGSTLMRPHKEKKP